MKRKLIFLLAAVLAVSSAAVRVGAAETANLFPSGSRIVFLGDSITYDGRYTHDVEAWFLTRFPDRDLDFINLGLPSEGVTGLTEPAHPFPRPSVHERLARVLEQLKPDIVFACYGMNDGIYHPFREDRFRKYKAGIKKLIDDVTASGAKIVLITPPPFDPVPVKDKLRADGASNFSWVNPYADYDSVMARYSDWLRHMDDPRMSLVVDARGPTLWYLAEHRKHDPNFFLAPDGVHTNAVGHRLIAQAIVEALAGGPVDLEKFDSDARASALLKVVAQRQTLIGRAWLRRIGHQRPDTPAGEPLESAGPKAVELHRAARTAARQIPAPIR